MQYPDEKLAKQIRGGDEIRECIFQFAGDMLNDEGSGRDGKSHIP